MTSPRRRRRTATRRSCRAGRPERGVRRPASRGCVQDDIFPAMRTSGDQSLPALLISALAYFENEVRHRAGRLPDKKPVAPHSPDLGHRALGAPVFLADPEDDGIDEAKGMIEH